MTTLTPQQIIDLPMGKNDARARTIGGYLAALLEGVLREGECFDGKRPFGNSNWEGEMMTALVKAEVIPGVIDEDGFLDDADYDAGTEALVGALVVLRGPEKSTGEVAYSAYFVACGGKSLVSGAELPSWDEQAEEIRAAWQAAADAVARAL